MEPPWCRVTHRERRVSFDLPPIGDFPTAASALSLGAVAANNLCLPRSRRGGSARAAVRERTHLEQMLYNSRPSLSSLSPVWTIQQHKNDQRTVKICSLHAVHATAKGRNPRVRHRVHALQRQ